MHVTLTSQRVVHGEGSGKAMTGMSACTQLQVVPQQLLVVGVSTVLDDGLCTLHRALATQIRHTLLRHDDIHIVLRAVLVGHERHHAGDTATLGHRRTGEDAQVGITDEVTRTADTGQRGGWKSHSDAVSGGP